MAELSRSISRHIYFLSLGLLPLLFFYHLASSLPTNASLGAPVPNCATLPRWREWYQASEKFDRGDCPKAINLFYNDYVKDHGGTRYEFLASGVTPVHGIPTQRVPLKVAIGKPFVQRIKITTGLTLSDLRHMRGRDSNAKSIQRRRVALRNTNAVRWVRYQFLFSDLPGFATHRFEVQLGKQSTGVVSIR